ncbi:Uncharacterised protein [Clostridium putrefaciens]|uniref:Uncharacterized protein n=1 Tax=Clostridium putrefaciens TaxID=99675 RepID=A0A381J476_9CLOT|nr:hypothetical protein [Clostridium putrefaciens]SUY45691.1 Uncharacterised protein [Clostridium putrefaciens]
MNDIINQKSKLNKLKMDIDITASIILCLYLFIDLLRFFNIIPLILGNALYVLIGSIAIIYSVFRKGIKRQIPIFCFMFFYISFGAIGILFNRNIDPQELLWPFAFIGLATLFLNFKINNKIAKIIYYFVIALLMIKIILSGGVNNLNTASSRNTIGIMILIYFAIYSITSYTCGKKIAIYPILLGFLVNVMAIGRSGILTFVLLIVLFSFLEFDEGKYKISNPIKSFIKLFVAGIILWIAYNILEIYFVEMMLNFQKRGLESVRSLIWSNYLTKTFTSARYVLFGTPISGTYLLDAFNYNLHNSFFMLHAKYGLAPLIVVIILIVKSFIYFIKTKNALYFMILLSVVFRMQFDYTNFNAQLDIILFYFMFFPYIKNEYNTKI